MAKPEHPAHPLGKEPGGKPGRPQDMPGGKPAHPLGKEKPEGGDDADDAEDAQTEPVQVDVTVPTPKPAS